MKNYKDLDTCHNCKFVFCRDLDSDEMDCHQRLFCAKSTHGKLLVLSVLTEKHKRVKTWGICDNHIKLKKE